MRQRLASFFRFLRSLTGADAYERYLHHHSCAHAGSKPLNRREFYLSQQRKKWSGVTRCC